MLTILKKNFSCMSSQAAGLGERVWYQDFQPLWNEALSNLVWPHNWTSTGHWVSLETSWACSCLKRPVLLLSCMITWRVCFLITAAKNTGHKYWSDGNSIKIWAVWNVVWKTDVVLVFVLLVSEQARIWHEAYVS